VTYTSHGLGRRYSEDIRDKAFPMAAAFAAVPTPNSKYWPIGPVLNQLQTPRCVGYASRQLLASSPHRYKAADPSADLIYSEAQKRDEWDGENYDGTSARGAMKYLAERGIISVYRWAQSVEELLQFVLTSGPALIGSNWHQNQFTPDAKAFVKPTGPVVGGHEYLMIGFNHKTGVCTFVNSWGADWADKGRFRMTRSDFEALMADDGDMVAPTES
jgi:hypothetical protein